MRLDELPVELITTILQLAAPRLEERIFGWRVADSVQTRTAILASCCLVCRKLESVARPLLYHTFVKPMSAGDVFEVDQRDEQYTLRLFLRTLIRRPNFRPYVKKLILLPWPHHRAISHDVKQFLVPAELIEYKHVVAEILRGYRLGSADTQWRQALLGDSQLLSDGQTTTLIEPLTDEYCEDAELALLLLLTPKLQYLQIDIPHRFDDFAGEKEMSFVRHALHEIVQRQVSDNSLSELQICRLVGLPDEEHPVCTLEDITEIFQLPSIISFQGILTADRNAPSFDEPCYAVGRSSIESLDFALILLIPAHAEQQRMRTPNPEVQRIVSSCKSLYHLRIELQADQDSYWNVEDWNSISEALMSQRQCLQHLGLVLYHEGYDDPKPCPSPIDSLTHFPSITSLEIDPSVFMKRSQDGNHMRRLLAEVLPPLIETLKIVAFEDNILPQLDDLLAVSPKARPNLRRIAYETKGWGGYQDHQTGMIPLDTEAHIERLYKGFKKVRIEFVEVVEWSTCSFA